MTSSKTSVFSTPKGGKKRFGVLTPAKNSRAKTPVAAPKSLSAWRVFSVLASLAGALFAFVSITASLTTVEQVGAAGHQIGCVQSAKSSMLAADGLAVSSLSAGEFGGQLDYSATLLDAVDDVSTAVAARGQGYSQDENLPQITREITGYAFSLGQTVASTGQPDTDLAGSVKASEEKLNSGVIPAMDTFISAEQTKIDERSSWSWVGIGMAIPLGVLVFASIKHAKLTRRVFNVGLLVAVVMVGIASYQVAAAGVSSASYHSSSGLGLYALTQQYGQTQIGLANALNIDGQISLQRGDLQALQEEWVAAIDQAKEGGLSDDLSQQISAYEQAHEAMLAGEDDPQLIAANASAALAAINTVEEARAATMQSFLGDVNSLLHSDAVSRASATVLSLLGALSCGLGLARPLRKYR